MTSLPIWAIVLLGILAPFVAVFGAILTSRTGIYSVVMQQTEKLREGAQDKSDNLQGQLDEISAQLNACRNDVLTARGEILSVRNENTDLLRRNNELEHENQQIKRDFAALMIDHLAVKARLVLLEPHLIGDRE